ncbi:hypothetical protein DXG03_008589 [Asterophora parasitica]|uniref:Uncharacterized protein n=1 Tax=Asterophora parasitica TaxID=117018 RepID=A0A9P7KA38_9AGAR|nr:hypothetical protein DXG03_008589 [Asterophora parasitica]
MHARQPCDELGNDLPPNTPPLPRAGEQPLDDYSLYGSRAEFELADFLYRKEQMSGKKIDKLMEIWATFSASNDPDSNTPSPPPFANAADVYNTIDSTELGDIPWQAFLVKYNGTLPDGTPPTSMTNSYEVWFRDPLKFLEDQIGNPDFNGEMDYAAYQVYGPDRKRRFKDMMCRQIGHGSSQYVVQLFHSSLAHILSSLKPWMIKPRITRCANRHFRWVIYGFGPYIADYPEQALLSCIVSGWCAKCTAKSTDLDGDPSAIPRSHVHTQELRHLIDDDLKVLWDGWGIIGDVIPFTAHFPQANIHELPSSDLLHQIIKGTFKDHLVTWVGEYLEVVHGTARANEILADIDRQIAAVPLFPGLRRFPEGRGFKQWTGDDSKALMKVYLPAIAGHVPSQLVRAISAFLEYCYLVRQSEITEDTLAAIDNALARFHAIREIFITSGVREDFLLPRQHSLVHYRHLIQDFGAPNGLCSSITESKHIKAVKEPWRRSNCNQPLGQMLLVNQHLDKLAAARVDFQTRGMLKGSGHPVLVPAIPCHDQGEVDDVEEDQGMTSLGDVQLAK